MKQELLYSGNFGLERETLRVDVRGRLAQTPHPFGDETNITRDFCENQVELITPVCNSIDEVLQSLQTLHDRTVEKLAQQEETLWIYSNPPHFDSEQEIPIARFGGEQSFKQSYREALEKRYGKRLMLFSGVHFNFSFSDALLHEWYDGTESFSSFRNALYLRLYRQLFRHSWLLVLLTAASPDYDASLNGDGLQGIIRSETASLRNSARGYWNQFVPVLNHTSLETFAADIQEYVNKGLLFSVSELYLPIRLKPCGENTLENLVKNGVDHIELRMFDLNPLCPLGVSRKDLLFAHLLILYLVNQEDTELTPEQQEQAVSRHQQAAAYYPEETIIKQALQILERMRQKFSSHPEALTVIEYQKQKLTEKRLCEQVRGKNFYQRLARNPRLLPISPPQML